LKPDSLGSIIGQFKSVCSKRIKAECGFEDKSIWQRGFYDHIIRSDADLHRIRLYIQNNPLRWGLNSEYPGNL
jgi:REP element-mobilizing transposase RayT